MPGLTSKHDEALRDQPYRIVKSNSSASRSTGTARKQRTNNSKGKKSTNRAKSTLSPTSRWLRGAEETVQEPVFFWKPKDAWGCLGQWYPSRFTDAGTGLTFDCCEQYMMYYKAKTFQDETVMQKMLETRDPRDLKALGRKVAHFTDHQWDEVKFGIVVAANMLKFEGRCMAQRDDAFVYPPEEPVSPGEVSRGNVSLREILLSTGDRELVEASPRDRIWGIGFSPARASDVPREKWGKNLLGMALMEVRRRLNAQLVT